MGWASHYIAKLKRRERFGRRFSTGIDWEEFEKA
jgi:hypothetical protein